jgi:hypothetical protein
MRNRWDESRSPVERMQDRIEDQYENLERAERQARHMPAEPGQCKRCGKRTWEVDDNAWRHKIFTCNRCVMAKDHD